MTLIEPYLTRWTYKVTSNVPINPISIVHRPILTFQAMEGFKWHQPPPQQPHETTTATALVSLTPVVPVSQTSRGGGPHSSQQPQNNNQDVINLQYMELEEFLLENAVAVTVPEHKGEKLI